MIQDVLRDIGGIGIYGIISICLFFLVFIGALLRACLLKKSDVHFMSSLPLREDNEGADLSSTDSVESARSRDR
ncbi:MAG: hypothetical protein HY735_10915 [Verrucomicrobia bacterium]|nr:hypothetical protein [Verrucomicrobiota bacterium]